MKIKKEKILLKDLLFSTEKIEAIASLIKEAYPAFQNLEFTTVVTERFPELELKERMVWTREGFKRFLPNDYKVATDILLDALPPICDPRKTDNDFGEFTLMTFCDFVAAYGCSLEDLDYSLNALEEITKRCSSEDSIRFFINAFPQKSLSKMEEWSKSENYHVRRLASEGSRPKLPWSQKINLSSEEVIKRVLTNLYMDPTRYVVRSVANHMNDISKDDPELVIRTLKNWKESKKQNSKEMDWLISHALRTLVKKGNPGALELLGYPSSPKIEVSQFKIQTPSVKTGSALEYSFQIESHETQNLMIDYKIHFKDKKGNLRPKVFKIKKTQVKRGEKLLITKKHPLKIMTTKKLYPGIHKVELQINGQGFEGGEFRLN